MSAEYPLPELPLGGERAVVVRWLRRPGDPVAVGAPLLIVVSDHAEVALPATMEGIFDQPLVAEGVMATVGAALARITLSVPPALSGPGTSLTREGAAVASSAGAEPAKRKLARTARRASPVALRIAATEAIDISELVGSGPGDRLLKRDVLAALNRQRATTNRSRAFAAVGPVLSPAGAPFSLTAMEVDLGRVAATCAELTGEFARRGLALTDLACVALCAVSALARHPLLNSIWGDEAIVLRRRVHLAVGGDLPATLVYDAQDLNLKGLARAIGRGGSIQLASQGFVDATFRITFCADAVWFDALIPGQPATSALGVGQVHLRPIVVSEGGVDRIAVRPTALLTLAYDARALDQRQVDAFLRDVRREIEQFGATSKWR